MLAEKLGLSPETNRRAVLAAAAGAIMGVGARPVFAGYVTNLGLATTAPKDADIDQDLLSSRPVQASLRNMIKYKNAAKTLKGAFEKDTGMQLIPTIRKEFDFSKLRDDLNVVTTVFDDDTQLTTDRLGRAILYDLTELENASRLKKEETGRTEKKIASVSKWFDKLDGKRSPALLRARPARWPTRPLLLFLHAPPPPSYRRLWHALKVLPAAQGAAAAAAAARRGGRRPCCRGSDPGGRLEQQRFLIERYLCENKRGGTDSAGRSARDG